MWGGIKASSNGFYFVSVILLALAAFTLYAGKSAKVIVSPKTRTVIARTFRGTKTYPFSEFLNFHILKNSYYGIATSTYVQMFFNENGKNKNVLLGIVRGRKNADKLIEETSSLLA